MLKSVHRTVAPIAAAALFALSSPAMALSAEAEVAFDAEIAHARSNMMANSARALDHARTAAKVAVGESAKAKKARLTAQWLEVEALMRLNRAADAFGIVESAIEETARNFSGSKLHADLVKSKASLNARKGAFAEALPGFLEAQRLYAELGEDRSRAMVLQNIGSVYSAARDFERALDHYERAEAVFPGDPALSLAAYNNMGNALKGLGRYEEAAISFAKALDAARAKPSPLLEARILTNIASAQVLDGNVTQGEQTARKAMAIAIEHAPDWTRFIDGVLAQAEFSRGRLDEAKARIAAAFEGEDLAGTGAHFREFHETAIQIYASAGDNDEAARHRKALERLDAQVARLDG